MSRSYVDRIVDAELATRLRSSGAVLVEGPRACGKSRTCERVAQTSYHLDVDDGARALANAAPAALFDAPAPILLDEWQVAPRLWDVVRREADERSPERGQFILTGSVVPSSDVARHTGAGRFGRMRMRTLSLLESGHSTGDVSLAALFDGELRPARDPGLAVPELMDRVVIGGWPALLGVDVPEAQVWVQDYLETVVADVRRLDGVRAPRSLARLLAALARGVGTASKISTLVADVAGPDGAVDRRTISDYLASLERLLLIEDLPAWAPHMRSSTPLRTSATRYFVDPSLGVGALGAGPSRLLRDLGAAGLHVESLVVRDLRVYSQPLGGTFSHWRDANGHEVDVVITLRDGRWGAIEIKMNPEEAPQAADSLKRFAAKVDTDRTGKPAFLAVVTAHGPTLRRDDGVAVVPIAALGP